MSEITKEKVLEVLSKVPGPDGSGNLVSENLIESVFISGSKVIFSLKVPAERAEALEPMRQTAEHTVAKLSGVEKATAILTAERQAGSAPASPPPRPAAPNPQQGGSGSASGKAGVPGIGSIIAVASGKGGVGKSTTAVNLALGLKQAGLRVGILDADIYGPSMPRMLGTSEKPKSEGRILNPLEAYGMKVMSIGFLVEEDTPMIWRGPMVISALTQMLREVDWGELDVLVVDMPPGTGDAQLTMAQQVPLAGAIIVSTPQDIALIDARKGLNMFRKVNVPILGLIENMSVFICPSCGHRAEIFGHGGAREEADKLGIPFLGEVPLHIDIRTNSDAGTPVTVAKPDSEHAQIYRKMGQSIALSLKDGTQGNAAPKIVFDS